MALGTFAISLDETVAELKALGFDDLDAAAPHAQNELAVEAFKTKAQFTNCMHGV